MLFHSILFQVLHRDRNTLWQSGKNGKGYVMYYIYKATNKVNGKVYIGQTVDFKRRKAEHESSKNGVHARCVFHKAIQKYGKHNFEWQIIDKCKTLDEALYLESKYIAEYNSCTFMNNSNGYNILFSQEGRKSFVHNSKKVIAYDLSGNFVGIYDSHEHAGRELNCAGTNIAKCLLGVRKSTGKHQFIPYSENYPIKISPHKTNELEAKYKRVYQYDMSFNFIQEFHSLMECADSVNGNRTALSRAIKQNKPYKNLIYSFEKL